MMRTAVRGTVYAALALSTLGYILMGIWCLAVIW